MAAQTPKMPEIKPGQKEEKKKGGLFADLFGRGGGSGFGGATGGAGLFNGLLATKAGLIALILAGTTMAGGIGLIGYKFFGPGDSDRLGSKLSLFNTRPPEPAGSASADANQSGNSDSLSGLAAANQTPAAPVDQVKADAAPAADAAAGAAAAAAAAGTNGAQKNASASAAMDAAKAKKASLSFKSGGVGGAAAAGSGGAAAGGGALHPTVAKGSSTGLGAGGARARAGGMRGMAGKMNAASQLAGVLSSQPNAKTSQAAGSVYDGAGTAGGDAGQPTGGAGSGASPNTSAGGNNGNGASLGPTPEDTVSPPVPGAANVTPWQNAINVATMLLVGAAALIFMASKLKTATGGMGTGAALAVCAIAAMMAGYAAVIGHEIASGPFGQVMQGNMFSAAGALLATSALGMGAMVASGVTGTPQTILTFVIVASGAMGIGAALVGKMSSPTSYPPNVFSNQPGGVAPDTHFGQYQYKVRGQEAPNEFIV